MILTSIFFSILFDAWAEIHDLKLTLPPSYAIGHYVELIMKKQNKVYEKYRCLTRMRVESLRKHVKRSKVRLSCDAEC
jgi:hypothetical protein